MKKIIALLLATMLLLTFAACNGSSEEGEPPAAPSESETEQATEAQPSSDNPSVAPTGDTVGETLRAAFLKAMEENPAASTQELAELLAGNPVIQFAPVTEAVTPGFLSGFRADIDGFADCTRFAPMIGSIPFMGYVFRLEDGADVDAFMQKLTDNADAAWNICVTAEETVIDHVGNTVFFVMCPRSLA